jgi:predicted MFS family arabinose efflux permease
VIAAVMIPLATASDSHIVSIACFCLALFGLELTVGVSWAVTLDIGGEFAGSVSAVMNSIGNLGAFVAATLTGYIVSASGWGLAFAVLAGLCVVAAVLMLTIDASRPLIPEPVHD